MTASHSQSSSQLRRSLRRQRREIPNLVRQENDNAIQKLLLTLVKSRNIGSLACFWPFDGEPDLIPVCKQLMQGDCEIALPVVSGDSNCEMEFHQWSTDTPVTTNCYGINEPLKTIPLSLMRFDMLLIPLVAYDKSGNRMGMGSGYYDRHLESIRDLQKPLRIGIAYQLQEQEAINKNAWDVPLHGVINETEWVSFI